MKCHTSTIILILVFTLTKVSISSPVPEPKAEPCLGLLLSLVSGLFRSSSFGGYGGQLGPSFVGVYPAYYPGVYYGDPYYSYYPYYPYPHYPGPVVVNPRGPIIVNPGGPITTTTTRRPILLGK